MDFSTGPCFGELLALRLLDLIFHAITPAFDDDRFGVVQKTVQHGAGQGAVVVEDFGPVFIRLVGRDDGRTSFIPLAEHLEEQVRADFIDRQISQFIDQNQTGVQVFPEFGIEAVSGLGRRQIVDDVDGGGEEHGMTREAARIGQRRRQVGLAEASAAHEYDIGLILEKGEAKEILHLGAVDFLGPGPIELFEGFQDGKAGRLDTALGRPILPAERFALGQAA